AGVGGAAAACGQREGREGNEESATKRDRVHGNLLRAHLRRRRLQTCQDGRYSKRVVSRNEAESCAHAPDDVTQRVPFERPYTEEELARWRYRKSSTCSCTWTSTCRTSSINTARGPTACSPPSSSARRGSSSCRSCPATRCSSPPVPSPRAAVCPS